MATPTGPGSGTTSRPRTRSEERATEHARTNTNNPYIKRVIGAIVLILSVVLVAIIYSGKGRQNSTTDTAVSSTEESAAQTERFVIDMPERTGHRLNSNGVKKRGDAEAFRKQIAEQAKRDPLTLFLYYQASPLGSKMPLENEAVIAKNGRIENGNVYSETGIEAYNKWLVFWETADIEAVREIKFQGVNTGVSGKRTTQAKGVSGKDKSGYNITYRNASRKVCGRHSALNRCTQPTSGKRFPGITPGPTDCGKPKLGQNDPNNPNRKGSIGQQVSAHKSTPTPLGSPRGTAESVTQQQQDSAGSDDPIQNGSDNPDPPPDVTPVNEGETDGNGEMPPPPL